MEFLWYGLFAAEVSACSLKALNFLQLGSYRLSSLGRYLKTENFLLLFAVSAICCALYFTVKVFALLVAAVLLAAVFVHERMQKKKTPLVFTKRVRRLIAATGICNFGLCFLFAPILPAAIPVICAAAVILTYPIEKAIGQYFLHKAKSALQKSGATVVGITGSFGKTGVKNILETLLKQKYRVFATPKSFNTPLGIARSINENGLKDIDIFVAELGARRKGDISELVRFVKPDYGIITGVAAAHLKTFKNLDNIAEEKFKLAKGLRFGGCCVFNTDNPFTRSMYFQTAAERKLSAAISDESAYAYADDIKLAADGSTFRLRLGEEYVDCSSALLGRHNVINVCLAAALAHKLGLTAAQIAEGVKQLQPAPHRLQPIKSASGLFVLDDSFNANLDGIRASSELLREFGGKKAVIACGIVEGGKRQYALNKQTGAAFAQSADFMILVGPNSAAIEEGLKEEGFCAENIFKAKSLDDAVVCANGLVAAGDVLLFSNDLPDNLS